MTIHRSVIVYLSVPLRVYVRVMSEVHPVWQLRRRQDAFWQGSKFKTLSLRFRGVGFRVPAELYNIFLGFRV